MCLASDGQPNNQTTMRSEGMGSPRFGAMKLDGVGRDNGDRAFLYGHIYIVPKNLEMMMHLCTMSCEVILVRADAFSTFTNANEKQSKYYHWQSHLGT